MFQVAAHCSGLFSSVRVRNVTSVCYPATRHAGALAVYHPKQACHQKPANCVIHSVYSIGYCLICKPKAGM